MSAPSRDLALALVALVGAPITATSQVVEGQVLSAVRGTPVAGALVVSSRSAERAYTDATGRFVLATYRLPDTLIIRAIGFEESRVSVADTGRIVVKLTDLPVRLPAVVAGARSFSLARSANVDWSLPSVLLADIPFGVETDPLRSLRLIPSVTFTSPLSGRPIVRGYDAWESVVSIDGLEVVNPYHLGRIFSALPPGLPSDVEVTLAPGDVTVGEANAARVNIATRSRHSGEIQGGAQLSLVSGSSWLSGSAGPVHWAGAGRVAHVEKTLAGVVDFPYNFSDLYLTAQAPLLGGSARAVGFSSRDRLINDETGEGMTWGNLLGGVIIERPIGEHTHLVVRTSASRFSEDVFDGPFRGEIIDVRNEFQRWSLDASLEARAGGHSLSVGLGVESRDIRNRIASTKNAGPPRFARNERLNVAQTHAYAGWSRSFGSFGVHGGLRLDDGPGEAIVQPRFRLTLGDGEEWYAQLSAGRTGRHYHVLAERIPEPELLFVDFWLPAGTESVPVAKIDHAALDLGVAVTDWLSARISGFASRGTGVGELTPFWVSGDAPFRFGQSRTWGLETHAVVGDSDGRSSLSATYALTWSERNWGDGWFRWSFDQRHRVRVHGVVSLGRVRFFAVGEAATGSPITPPTQWVLIPDLDVPDRRFARDEQELVEATLLFGRENSVTGPGTGFMDVGVSIPFRGLWSSRWKVSLSVLNVTASAVAPGRPPRGGGFVIRPGTPIRRPPPGDTVDVPYGRLFDMPPVPSLLITVQF